MDEPRGWRMPSPEIRRAREALAQERSRIVNELSRVEQALVALESVVVVPGPLRLHSGTTMSAIAQIIQEDQRTWHADEVVDVAKQRGVHLSFVDPKATVVTALHRLAAAGDAVFLGRNQFRWNDDTRIAESDG